MREIDNDELEDIILLILDNWINYNILYNIIVKLKICFYHKYICTKFRIKKILHFFGCWIRDWLFFITIMIPIITKHWH